MRDMMKPKVAMGNIFPDQKSVRDFAREHGFSGIEWSFGLAEIPRTPTEQSAWVHEAMALSPFEVRFHCPFHQVDLGHDDPDEAKAADDLFRHIIRLVSKTAGTYLTIHVGLGLDSMETLSWERTIKNLREW